MVRRGAEDIKSMRVRGATRLALYAAEVLVKAMDMEGEEANRGTLEDFSVILLNSRPTAISLSNALRYMLEMGGDYEGASLLKKLQEAYESLKSYVVLAQKRIEKNGEGVFEGKKKQTVLTHCNSQTAIGVIRRGWERSYVEKVFSLEARPRYQGRITVKQLSAYGVETIMIVDSACNYYMGEVDRVIVGADTAFPNGDLVNKIGTSQVALISR
ncbi:MAG: ribose 1,5-bisphosphate isomerase, partial [Thermoplasmata archaeon]|nr:ribose 1,5-bisphosphate isomerase [Thermoplasmata archaeon]